MKLYSLPHSPYAARVRIQIYAKQLPVDIAVPEGFRTAEYKKINPTGKVPALDTGSRILPESAVIMDYLEALYPALPLYPDDIEDRATVNLFCRVVDTYLSTALFPLFAQVFQKDTDKAQIAQQLDAMKVQLKLLDQLFADYGREQHTSLDLADCTLAPVLFYVLQVCSWFGEPDALRGCERLQRWWQWANDNTHISRVIAEMDEGLTAFLERVNT